MTNYKSDVAIFSRASIPSQAKAPYLGCLICNPALLLILLLIKFSSSSPSSSSSSSSSSLPPHHYHHNYFSLLILPSFPLPHYRLLYLLLFPQSLLVGWLSFFPSRLPPPYSFLLYFLIFYQYIHQLIFLLPPHPLSCSPPHPLSCSLQFLFTAFSFLLLFFPTPLPTTDTVTVTSNRNKAK